MNSNGSFLNTIFQKMIEEQKSDYTYKDDLIRNYINLIIHEALKTAAFRTLRPSIKMLHHASLLFSLNCSKGNFLLKVPIIHLRLKTAQDYANALHVHVNYLNRAVKEVTGKSTTTHITERIVSEAKALLAAYCLEYCRHCLCTWF